MTDDRVAAVAQLWEAHTRALFPSRLRGTDAVGVEMVTLDADVAGCVGVWLLRAGSLDESRCAVIAARRDELALVLASLVGDEAVYCRRLYDMAMLILQADIPPSGGPSD